MTATARSVVLRSIAQGVEDALPLAVEEVVLTGSVSRGVADDISDIEMLIVTKGELELGDCFSLAAACGLTDLGTWGQQGVPTKRVSGYRDGVPVELIWWSPETRFVGTPCWPHVPRSVSPQAAAREKQSPSSSSPLVTISISMSEMSSATPRETLPVSTTSSTASGSASSTPWAIERKTTLRAVAVIRPPYFDVSRVGRLWECPRTGRYRHTRLTATWEIPAGSGDRWP